MSIIAREKQFHWLSSALGTTQVIPGCLFMWGPPSTGKKYVIDGVLRRLKIRITAQISAKELLCTRSFLESILFQLGEPDGNFKCDNGRNFLRSLNSLFPSILKSTDRVVVVIHHAELLRENEEVLYTFINAQDIIRQNICFVLSSTLPWESLTNVSFKDLPTLHFPQYKKDELENVLAAKEQNLVPHDVYSFYVKMIVSYFFMCRDLRQLSRLVNYCLVELSERIYEMKDYDQSNLRMLYKMIEPKMKKIYGTTTLNLAPMFPSDQSNVVLGKLSILNEMPIFSKYIIVAAYIASNNPVNSDRKYFVKLRAGRKLKAADDHAAMKSAQAFPITRLFAILASLNKDILFPMDHVIRCQLTTLCTVGLLARVGDDLEDCKYKCQANLELVKLISKDLDIEIEQYLCRSSKSDTAKANE